MTDPILESNTFFQYLQNDSRVLLKKWREPSWKICIPYNDFTKDFKFTPEFAESQALWRIGDSQQYISSLFEDSLYYQIVGENERSIVWNSEREFGELVSKALILNEYLITVEEHVVHVLLIDHPLPSMVEEDQDYMTHPLLTVASAQEAEYFLKGFHSHYPVLKAIEKEIQSNKSALISDGPVDLIQSNLHSFILSSWENLIKRHVTQLQTDSGFQDLLFRALDFFIVGFCHEELWAQISPRCLSVDHMVTTRMTRLRSINLSQTQLGLPEGFYTPLPAAIVEIATLNARTSAIDRLNCIRDTIELIQAHAKETWATLKQLQDSDAHPQDVQLTENELLALLVIVLVKSQCTSVVSNIYYMTHYVFSITDENNPLWQSLHMLRRSLQLAMTIDIGRLTPESPSLRKELSLQDLMQVTVDVEAKIRAENSRSIPDLTAIDLHMQDLTRKLQASTQALSALSLEQASPHTRTRRVSIMNFLSSIPSTIRASFRRKQTEQKSLIHNSVKS